MLTRTVRLFLIMMSLAMGSLGLVACGSQFHSRIFDVNSKDLTGAKNAGGLPYTGASDSVDLENLKQAIDPSIKGNLTLATSIASVIISRVDLAGNPVATSPSKLELILGFQSPERAAPATKPNAPTVHAKIDLKHYEAVLDSSREAKAVVAKDDDGAAKLNVKCLDPDCSAVQVRITSAAGEAGFLYRIRAVKVEALGPFAAGGSTARLERIGTLASSSGQPILVTTEVAWGPSMFTLTAGDVIASGDLVATGGDEQNVSVQIKNETPIDGRLIGNNNHGDLLLRFADQNAWSFLRLRLPAAPSQPPEDTTTPVAPVDTTPAGEKFIPFETSNPITMAFEKDRTNPVVAQEIKTVSQGSRANDMQQFLNRAGPNVSAMVHDLQTQAIPPELIFLTFIESRYFYSNYEIQVSPPKAVGPWQFMIETARSLGLTAFDPLAVPTHIVNGKQQYKYVAKVCDDRGDLHLSTLAAAKYLRSLLDTFRNDPKLAIMAYNMGAGGLNRRLNCLNENKASNCKGSTRPLIADDLAGLDYWTIRDLNAAPKESIDYVPRFLGAQFVGREPSRYGLKVDSTGIAPAPIVSCH